MNAHQQGGDALFILLGAIMVLAMHAGFAFLEVGTVRKKNQVNALVKILVDFSVSTVVYFLVGYGVAYGTHFLVGAETLAQHNGFALVKFFFLLTFAAAIPAIVSGGIALAIGPRAEFVEDGAERVNNVEIRLFVPAADVVDLAELAGFKDAADGTAVISDVEPVADLLTIAVDGQGFAGQRVMDDQGDELFREVVGAVVVGAVGGQHRQAVGMAVGTDQMVAGGLAGGVWAVGFVTVGFGEGGVVLGEGAIDFVGRDMEETEGVFGLVSELTVVGTHRFKQAEGADDVGLDEVFGSVNAAVDLGFGREIDDSARLMFSEQLGDEIEVVDAAFDEGVAGIAFQRGEVFQIARVGQGIEVDDRFVRLRQPVEDKVTADEAGTAGHKNGH